MKTKFDHIGVYARDSDALADWYKDKLGFKENLRLDKSIGSIYWLKPDIGSEVEILPAEGDEGELSEFKKPGTKHIAFTVDDFSEVQSELESKGISLHGVRDVSQGWRIGYFEDPEGNTIEIVEGKETW